MHKILRQSVNMWAFYPNHKMALFAQFNAATLQKAFSKESMNFTKKI